MGRSVRRVKIGWEHPVDPYTKDYRPIFDHYYKDVLDEWIEEYRLWEKGEHPDQQDSSLNTDGRTFWDWDGGPPDPERYLDEDWSELPDDQLGWALYESVTEGTPVTPVYDTAEELVECLAESGTWVDGPWDRKAAEQMVRERYAPTFTMIVLGDA